MFYSFQYQLDWADLQEKANGCERVYIEVVASYSGGSVPVFSGVYKYWLFYFWE